MVFILIGKRRRWISKSIFDKVVSKILKKGSCDIWGGWNIVKEHKEPGVNTEDKKVTSTLQYHSNNLLIN